MRGTLVIFIKAPRAGRVKTRLGADIGMGAAAALFRIMTMRTILEAEKSGVRVVLAVDPVSALEGWGNLWPPHLPRMAQWPGGWGPGVLGQGDLGARMGRFFAGPPGGPVAIIGADAPGLRARHLRAAFDALRGADAVFGPAADGGYWLIGLARRRAAPDLFRGVRWSTKHALADTRASLPEEFAVAMLETLQDIDGAEDLSALGPHAGAR